MCAYSIDINYWNFSNIKVHSTGKQIQRFGKVSTSKTIPYKISIPKYETQSNRKRIDQIYVMFSFTFPSD
jgi:hypothetical protein